MQSLSIGPLAFPVAPLLVLAALLASAALARRLARRAAEPSPAHAGPASIQTPPDGATPPSAQVDAATDAATDAPTLSARAGDDIWMATFVGLLAARAGWLLLHLDSYTDTPWSMLDIRDGGWYAPAGVLAGGAWLAWKAWRTPALRRPLASAGVLGLALWLGAGLAVQGSAVRNLPAVAVQPLSGGPGQSLEQLAPGQARVINLWATWCAPCRREMPDLLAAARANPEVAFVFVNQGETAPLVEGFARMQGLPPGSVWLDPPSALGPAVGSTGLPTTLFVDARGRLVHTHFGLINAAALQARLHALRRTP